MSTDERDELLCKLAARFEKHSERHQGIPWRDVRERLMANSRALSSLRAMEATGGEPDVFALDPATGACLFADCSAESPAGRRSLCYDRAALDARKENKPKGNALEMAATLGVFLLNEQQYRHLQTLGEFDTKTSSWISTPAEVRKLGGALFCDRRFGRTFVYHNGAESYYAARGFRGGLQV